MLPRDTDMVFDSAGVPGSKVKAPEQSWGLDTGPHKNWPLQYRYLANATEACYNVSVLTTHARATSVTDTATETPT